MDENAKEQLQTDLLFINNELQAERQKGAEGDSGKIAQLEQRKADIQYQLDGINKVEKAQAIEEKVHSEITFAIPGVDFTQLPVELITIIHAVVKADRRKNLSEHSAEMDKLEREYDAYKQNAEGNYNGLLAKHNQLEQEYETAARELKEQTEENVRLIAERDDARKNRDNAAAQLEEAKAEIARLESQVDDYQKAKVLGERQAQAVIDVTTTEADEINEAIKKLFVKSENWGSVEKLYLPDGSFKVVKRDELEEWAPITPPPVLGGVDGQDSFRSEDTESDVEVGGVPATENAVTPSQEETAVPAISLPGTLATEKDEVIRRLERLEIAVFGQGQVA